ncbi:MAG: carbamoyl-phosphate synthase (glutamine-hydrolyzing) large subunit [Pseudomonadales bacterium]
MYGAYLPSKPKCVLVLGSGALQIGQAGEFDYSGSQALKAMREEGIATVLINPNIATIQTSEGLADRIYLNAVTPEFVEQIIEAEQVDALLLAFGGQTALNCGIELHDRGILQRHGVRVLGTPVEVIRTTEDRQLFKESLDTIGVKSARSVACNSLQEARKAAGDIGLPLMLRGAFALGGKGSSYVDREEDLEKALMRAFNDGAQQVLVEEGLRGWKEIEYEVVRDARDNCITVCNMENFDPLGIHTGESIVVAPSQTLNDEEYQMLRTIAVRTIRHLGIVGECNIQYALDPMSNDYRVIEVNARLSRSSALASKATGYPLAYVAAKLALGYCLPDITNSITRRTSAFFEPALDYMVCKMPRWDLNKFAGAAVEIGSEMKSVGEVMAIGRNFSEVLQKALRMLDIGVDGLDARTYGEIVDLQRDMKPTPRRIFAIAAALKQGYSIEEIHHHTRIDRWFLQHVQQIVETANAIEDGEREVPEKLLAEAKRIGFSDSMIGRLTGAGEMATRERRKALGIVPHYSQIDTLAAEFPAETNYLYASHSSSADDVPVSTRRKLLVLGSGCYRIGSSVEFDWCAVNAVNAAARLGFETIMLNCNPETVSTDYDTTDELVFEEVSFESVCDLYEREKPEGIIVSMGGQLPNNLALKLHQAGLPILGTSPENIDRAEDRRKFSSLLDELDIDQPAWTHVTDIDKAEHEVENLGGYPVLVRPSYVLSGAAMSVAHEPQELVRILLRAREVSPDHPVVLSKFETHAREVEIDAVADKGELIHWAISEHIEDAGVHSGDATLVLPPQKLYLPTIRKVKDIAGTLARALDITGPFNVQFLARQNWVKVIECNLRASRSLPFVSKVLDTNFAAEATRCMLGAPPLHPKRDALDLDYVGVKLPKFSFSRLVGADPLLGVEMSSTGEVGCIGETQHEALLHALLATDFRFPRKGILMSLGPWEDKFWFSDDAHTIKEKLNLPIYATEGTAQMLESIGIECHLVGKEEESLAILDQGTVDLVINIPKAYDEHGRPDGFHIRRKAIDAGISLITDRKMAGAIVEALRWLDPTALRARAWNGFVQKVEKAR